MRLQRACPGQSASLLLRIRALPESKPWKVQIVTNLLRASCDEFFRLLLGIVSQAMPEIFRHVKDGSAADRTDTRNVVSGIEQVRAMRRRVHETFMNTVGSLSLAYIFRDLI